MADTVGNIEAFEMWTLRRMLKISWKKKVTNKEVLRRARVKREMLYAINMRKTRYFGHIIRQNGVQGHLLEGKVNGTTPRPRGRSRTDWISNIKEWLEMNKSSTEQNSVEDSGG